MSFTRDADSRVITVDTHTLAALAAAEAAATAGAPTGSGKGRDQKGSGKGRDWELYQALTTPLPWWLRAAVRFRSFDVAYSPCRH